MPRKNFLRFFSCFCVFNFLIVVSSVPDKEIKEELPSKIQQKKFIDTGRELCSFVSEVVTREAKESEASIQKDVALMIQRARKQLSLEEENFRLRLSCSNNNVKSRGILEAVQQLARGAETALGECFAVSVDQASVIASKIRTKVVKLEQKGRDILDAFLDCSKKGSWSMFACYKKAVNANLSPMEELVTETVRAHSAAHTDFLTLRSNAEECTQSKLQDFRNRVEAKYSSYTN